MQWGLVIKAVTISLAFTGTVVLATSDHFPESTDSSSLHLNGTGHHIRQPLSLCGQAKLKAYKVFTVGQGALYRPDCAKSWQLNETEPKLMFFRYNREIPGHAFAESAEAILQRNIELNAGELAILDAFHKHYRDIGEGDTYTISYSPDAGLRLYLNDNLLGKLVQQPLAHQYFSIWLGEKPFDEKLKTRLLGDG